MTDKVTCIMLSARCGTHFREKCANCNAAARVNDRELSRLRDTVESLTSERDKWRKLAAEANEALSRCLDHMDEHSSEPAFEAYQAGLAALTAFNTAEGGREDGRDNL